MKYVVEIETDGLGSPEQARFRVALILDALATVVRLVNGRGFDDRPLYDIEGRQVGLARLVDSDTGA